MVKLVCPPKNINRPCYNWQGLGCFAGALLIGIIVGVSFVLLGTRPVQTEQRELQNICKPEVTVEIDMGGLLRGYESSTSTKQVVTKDVNPKK